MAQFTINGFARGMDVRRPTWAAGASTLQLAKDVVLNEGGDAEVRKAFVPKYTLPNGTYGLRDVEDTLVVFGNVAAGSITLPSGVEYRQLAPNDGAHVTEVLSSDLFDGKPYIAASMSDGSTRHFFDENSDGIDEQVTDWFDGRARSSFEITAGATGSVTRIDVNGVDVLGSTVAWATSHVNTASLIAAQITSHTSTPNYDAIAIGATVIIRAADGAGVTPNGYSVAVTVTGDFVVSAPTTMENGIAGSATPGDFVLTHDNKLYSPAGPLLNYSGIDSPTHANTDYDGAGFIDVSRTQSAGEDNLSAAPFLEELAVLARKCIQIFHVEAEDINNRRVQTFKHVGIDARRAREQFRGTDLFFLERVRGVQAIVPSGTEQQFAKIEDVGLPIKKFLRAYQDTLTADVIERAIALVEPSEARFWLVLGERVFVYSWHPQDDIQGWTYFEPGFQITDYAIKNGRLYLRSGNTIYLYGGDDDDQYPASGVGEITFAAFRASAPERVKAFSSVDFGAEGTWDARIYAGERDTVGRPIATITQQTFDDAVIGMQELGPNPILKMTRRTAGYARVCQLVVNYLPARSA